MGKISEEGYHNGCKVTGAELMPPEDGKKPQVAVGFENAAGDYITAYLYLTDGALKYTVEKLRACGWTGNDLSDLSECVGKMVDIKVGLEEYNGKASLKVKSIYKPKDRTKKAEITHADAKALAAQYMSKIAALSIPSADPRPEPPPPDEEPPLPF